MENKYKLIDEKVLSEKIRKNQEILKSYINADDSYPEDLREEGIMLCNTFIEAYEWVKEQLQSPKEIVTKAFEAGEEYGRNVTLFNNTDRISRSEMEATPDLYEYLENNNYD